MATKTLTITEEAYESLKAHKHDGESFTETVLRLTGGERDVLKGHGALADVEGFREEAESVHEELNEDFDRREDALYGQ
jgi:predicted CopG family antitoxin